LPENFKAFELTLMLISMLGIGIGKREKPFLKLRLKKNLRR